MKLLLCCNFLCLFLQVIGRNNNDSLLLNDANQSFDNKLYNLASLKYEEIIFCTDNEALSNTAKLKKAYCKKMLALHASALKELERIEIGKLNQDSLKYAVYHEMALMNYLTHHYLEAEANLKTMKNQIKDSLLISNSNYLWCLVLAEQNKWDEAEYYLNLHLQTKAPYDTVVFKNYKDLKKAKMLSYLFPGLGQCYAGSITGGVSAAVFQLGMLGFTILNFYNGFYFSAIFTGIPLLTSFIRGDKNHTVFLVNKRNSAINNKRKAYYKNAILSR